MKKLVLFILIAFLITCSVTRAQIYSLNSINSTTAGTAIQHSLFWQDTNGLSSYIFSFDDCTGELSNITSGTFSGNGDWSNVTIIVNNSDCFIRWKVYANNTNDNWNASDTYSYFATSIVPPQISIISLSNETYFTGTLALEFSIDRPVEWIGYSLNGEPNITILGNTSLDLAADSYHLIIYATDDLGSTGVSEVFFTVSTSSLEIFVDNYFKKPGERLRIDAVSSGEMSEASFSIVKPDGSLLNNPIALNIISSNVRSENYSLGTDILEGIYTINVNAIIDGQAVGKNIKFSVKAWDIFLTLNKYIFDASGSLNLAINILDAYSSELDLAITANLTKPNRNVVEIYRNLTKGSSITNVTYEISKNYPNGTSTITVYVNDSYGRLKQGIVSFFKKATNLPNETYVPFLSVTPDIWSEVTTINKSFQRYFELENSAEINISNISVSLSEELSEIVHVAFKPDIVPPNSKINITIEIYTGSESKNYSGRINVYSSNGNPQIYTYIEILGNISLEVEEYLNEITSLEEEIGNIEKSGKNIENISESINDLKKRFFEVADYYISGDMVLTRSKMNDAIALLSDIKIQIDNLKLEETENQDYTNIIWIFTALAAAAIFGIFLIKFLPRMRKKRDKKEEVIEVYSKKDI